MSIKKGDKVEIIAGDDRKKQGEVIKIFPKTSQALVANCNISKKSIKPTEKNGQKTGYVSKEMPIHLSNIKKIEVK